MAVIVPGQFSLTHTRSTSDSLDLIIREGVFKNFTLDARKRLQYNSSRWRQRAVINKDGSKYFSVNPLPTIYDSEKLVIDESCYEYTIDLREFPKDQEIWIPVDYLPNSSELLILSIYLTDSHPSGIYENYDEYYEIVIPHKDGPGKANFNKGIILNLSDLFILMDYFFESNSSRVNLGYTYLDGRYLIHVLYSLDYHPDPNQYNSVGKEISTFDTKYYTKYIGLPVLILDSRIRGYQDSESLIYLYDDSIHYKDEYVSLPKNELFNTDLVEYVEGDINVLTDLPSRFIISLQNYCDERSESHRYHDLITDILNEEYYLRCIIIDEILSESIILLIQDIIKNPGIDNAPNISLVVMSDSEIEQNGSIVQLSDEIYDSGGSILMRSVDAFYKVVESLDSGITYRYITVIHERPGLKLESSIDDTSELPQVEDYHYNADRLDEFILQLYINTFHACINKCREEIIAGDDKEKAIKNALITYGAPDSYDYEVVTTGEGVKITCSVDYKKKIEVININLNFIING